MKIITYNNEYKPRLTYLCFQGSHNFACSIKNSVIFIGADHLTLEGGGRVISDKNTLQTDSYTEKNIFHGV